MIPILAMAGLAEVGEYLSILFWRGVIGLAVLLALPGFVRRSKILAWVALAVIAFAIAVVQPWNDFIAHPMPADPDAIYWLSKWRELSVLLVAGSIATVLLVVGTIVRGPRIPEDGA
jgi:hypothetical protein